MGVNRFLGFFLYFIFLEIIFMRFNVKIGDNLGTIAEQLRIIAHCRILELPPIAMIATLATFATFAVASRRAYGLRTQLPPRLTRQLTHLVLVASMLQQHLSCIRPQRLY